MGTKKGETKTFTIHESPLHYFYIRLSGGGQLPDVLAGHYSTRKKAEAAIESHLESKKPKSKVKKDA